MRTLYQLMILSVSGSFALKSLEISLVKVLGNLVLFVGYLLKAFAQTANLFITAANNIKSFIGILIGRIAHVSVKEKYTLWRNLL